MSAVEPFDLGIGIGKDFSAVIDTLTIRSIAANVHHAVLDRAGCQSAPSCAAAAALRFARHLVPTHAPDAARAALEIWAAEHHAADATMNARAAAVLDTLLVAHDAKAEASVHEPPSTVTIRWCSRCGHHEPTHTHESMVHHETIGGCDGIVQDVTYELPANVGDRGSG